MCVSTTCSSMTMFSFGTVYRYCDMVSEMEIITIVHMVINGDMVMTGTPAKKDERTGYY